jgi:L-lactate utilization protein LutC
MTTARETFLKSIRDAVREGNRAGTVPSLPDRGHVGYQGGGVDLIARFKSELQAAGGHGHVVASMDDVMPMVKEFINKFAGQRVAVDRSPLLQSLQLADELTTNRLKVWQEPPELDDKGIALDKAKRQLFDADIGITGVDYLIAETGSIILLSKPGAPRSVSLLPPVHIAVATRDQLLPDLFDLFDKLDTTAMPACVSIITGPSKTGDIELQLVTGVHGPGEVHVILLPSPSRGEGRG